MRRHEVAEGRAWFHLTFCDICERPVEFANFVENITKVEER